MRRELTNLNWLDLLTGQVDRHAHNYFVERDADGNVTGVKGIDNDLAFGRNTTHPHLAGKSQGLKGTYMPGVIDQSTYDKLMSLSADGPDGLRARLNGLLDDAEIEATIQRLKIIQNTLKSYKKRRPGIEGRGVGN